MNQQIIEINNFLYQLKDPNFKGDIYEKLKNFGIDPQLYSRDIRTQRDFSSGYIYEKLESLKEKQLGKGLKDVVAIDYEYQDNNINSFIHIGAMFKDDAKAPMRDVIKMYIPIDLNNVCNNINMIHDFLLNSKISFESKIAPTVRADIFCLRLNNVKDVQAVLKFCEETKLIDKEKMSSNPFVPRVNGIGFAKDTYHISYNSEIANSLLEYRNKYQQSNVPKEELVNEFVKFLNDKVKETKNSKAKFMYKQIALSMNVILSGDNILNHMQPNNEVTYDNNLFSGYKRFHDEKGYIYKDKEGKIIDRYSNPDLYIKLQANNCMQKIYAEHYGELPKENFMLNEAIVKQISTYLDVLNDYSMDYAKTIQSNHQDIRVAELLPYLYAAIAITKKDCNTYRALEIMEAVKKNVIRKVPDKEINDGVVTYQNNKKIEIKSTYPLIKTSEGTIGIEMLDNGLANLYLCRKDKVQKISNIVIELKKELIENDSDLNAQEYRAQLAKVLLDDNRNQRMIKERNGDFGFLLYDEYRKKINKLVRSNEELGELKARRMSGEVPGVLVEEQVYTR